MIRVLFFVTLVDSLMDVSNGVKCQWVQSDWCETVWLVLVQVGGEFQSSYKTGKTSRTSLLSTLGKLVSMVAWSSFVLFGRNGSPLRSLCDPIAPQFSDSNLFLKRCYPILSYPILLLWTDSDLGLWWFMNPKCVWTLEQYLFPSIASIALEFHHSLTLWHFPENLTR